MSVHGHTSSNEVQLESGVRVPADSVERECMRVPCEYVEVVVSPLQERGVDCCEDQRAG